MLVLELYVLLVLMSVMVLASVVVASAAVIVVPSQAAVPVLSRARDRRSFRYSSLHDSELSPPLLRVRVRLRRGRSSSLLVLRCLGVGGAAPEAVASVSSFISLAKSLSICDCIAAVEAA